MCCTRLTRPRPAELERLPAAIGGLNAVIAEYLQAAQAGRTPDRREFLERHWDLTDGLVSFFAQ